MSASSTTSVILGAAIGTLAEMYGVRVARIAFDDLFRQVRAVRIDGSLSIDGARLFGLARAADEMFGGLDAAIEHWSRDDVWRQLATLLHMKPEAQKQGMHALLERALP